MIGMIKGTMRQKKEVNGLPLPIASYKANLKAPIRSLKVAINATQSGSGTPAPDNIRPISGWNGCNVTRCGKNLVANKKYQYNANNVFFGVDNADIIHTIFLKEGTYTFSYISSVTGILNVGNSQTSWNTTNTSYTFTVSTPDYYRFWVYKNGITVSDIPSFQLEVGSQATAYEAYTGNTYTIDLDGTRYGGRIDIVDGEAVMTVTHAIVDLGTLTYTKTTYGSNTCFYADVPLGKSTGGASQAFAICSQYVQANSIYIASNADKTFTFGDAYIHRRSEIKIVDNDYANSTVEQFKSAMNGVSLVYELATPFTVQLSPTQIEQLLGANNVFADCGDVEELIYTDRQVYYGR